MFFKSVLNFFQACLKHNNLGHEDLALSEFGHVDHLLDDVVCELVSHHAAQGTVGPVSVEHLFDEHGPLCPGCIHDTLLDHVARELVLCQMLHLASQLLHYFALVLRPSMLQNVLKCKAMLRGKSQLLHPYKPQFCELEAKQIHISAQQVPIDWQLRVYYDNLFIWCYMNERTFNERTVRLYTRSSPWEPTRKERFWKEARTVLEATNRAYQPITAIESIVRNWTRRWNNSWLSLILSLYSQNSRNARTQSQEMYLYDVIAVLVLHQLLRVCVQLLQNGRRLLASAVLQDSLDHPAAVRVRRQFIHLQQTSTKNTYNSLNFQKILRLEEKMGDLKLQAGKIRTC